MTSGGGATVRERVIKLHWADGRPVNLPLVRPGPTPADDDADEPDA